MSYECITLGIPFVWDPVEDSMLVRKTNQTLDDLELLECEQAAALAQRESELAELALLKEKLANLQATKDACAA